jgi:hypothetical protein
MERQTFLTHVGNKGEAAVGLQARGIHGVHDRQQRSETAAVVADTRPLQNVAHARDVDIRAWRKDRVEMRGDDHMRMRHRARTIAQHIARLVDAYVLKTFMAKELGYTRGALVLMKRRRRNLTELNLLVDEVGAGVVQRLHGQLDVRLSEDHCGCLCERRKSEQHSGRGYGREPGREALLVAWTCLGELQGSDTDGCGDKHDK